MWLVFSVLLVYSMRSLAWVHASWDEKFWNPDHVLYTEELDVVRLLQKCGMLHEKLFMVTLTRDEVKEAVDDLTMVQRSVVLAGEPMVWMCQGVYGEKFI